MILRIDNLDIFKKIYEINITAEPNQSFDCYINDNSFSFDITTFSNNDTRISIKRGDEVLANNASIFFNLNLIYFSKFKGGAFFFIANENIKETKFNFENFNNGVRFYYGSF